MPQPPRARAGGASRCSPRNGFDDRLASREADPADLARLADLIDTLLSSFPEGVRPVLEATLRGDSAEMISQSLSYPVRTVGRVRERFRERLNEELGDS